MVLDDDMTAPTTATVQAYYDERVAGKLRDFTDANPRIEAAIEGNDLVLAGTRTLPKELGRAVIHRLELPQGRFERRLRLPGGRYTDIRRSIIDGCLVVVLTKAEAARG